jgi:hypothetical protein
LLLLLATASQPLLGPFRLPQATGASLMIRGMLGRNDGNRRIGVSEAGPQRTPCSRRQAWMNRNICVSVAPGAIFHWWPRHGANEPPVLGSND